jgi:hypothetical protein
MFGNVTRPNLVPQRNERREKLSCILALDAHPRLEFPLLDRLRAIQYLVECLSDGGDLVVCQLNR